MYNMLLSISGWQVSILHAGGDPCDRPGDLWTSPDSQLPGESWEAVRTANISQDCLPVQQNTGAARPLSGLGFSLYLPGSCNSVAGIHRKKYTAILAEESFFLKGKEFRRKEGRITTTQLFTAC